MVQGVFPLRDRFTSAASDSDTAPERTLEQPDRRIARSISDTRTLCGLPKPPKQSGKSLLPLLKNPNASWDRPAYSVTVYGKSLGRSIRTAKWHYVEWDAGKSGNMLYATEDDPHELKNLSNDPKYAKTVAAMKALLAKMP